MNAKEKIPWWAWVTLILVLTVLFLLLRARRTPRTTVNVYRDSIPLPMELRSADDLTEIKGIGVKSASVLNAAGITTFAQLAAAPPDDLREILKAANLRLVDPETWPDQAQALG